MESDFDLDTKVLRSYSDETPSRMTSGEITKLIELNPLTSTRIFHERPVRQAFIIIIVFACVCLSDSIKASK